MEKVTISMPSLVDVCMTLLIVFMVSGTMIIEPALKVDLPKAVTNEEKEGTDKIILYVSSDGKYAIDEMVVEYKYLEKLLTKKLPVIDSGLVVIKADKNAKYKDLVNLVAIAKQAGATSITIATTQKKEK